MEETKREQRVKLEAESKKKQKNTIVSRDANLVADDGEREVKVLRNKLTMDEFYREEELNWNYRRTREKEGEGLKRRIEVPLNYFEHKLIEEDNGKSKLESLLKQKKQSNGFDIQTFLKDKVI